jgi:hypothetical protein
MSSPTIRISAGSRLRLWAAPAKKAFAGFHQCLSAAGMFQRRHKRRHIESNTGRRLPEAGHAERNENGLRRGIQKAEGPVQIGEIPGGAHVADHHVARASFGVVSRDKFYSFKCPSGGGQYEQGCGAAGLGAQPIGSHFAGS